MSFNTIRFMVYIHWLFFNTSLYSLDALLAVVALSIRDIDFVSNPAKVFVRGAIVKALTGEGNDHALDFVVEILVTASSYPPSCDHLLCFFLSSMKFVFSIIAIYRRNEIMCTYDRRSSHDGKFQLCYVCYLNQLTLEEAWSYHLPVSYRTNPVRNISHKMTDAKVFSVEASPARPITVLDLQGLWMLVIAITILTTRSAAISILYSSFIN